MGRLSLWWTVLLLYIKSIILCVARWLSQLGGSSCHSFIHSFSLSLSLSLTHTHTHTHTYILCRRKDHTLSQPVREAQRQSCSLFRSSRLCNVVRKTLISGAAESALLHHWTILSLPWHFLSLPFMIKKISACKRLQWEKKKIIFHCCLGVAYILHQILVHAYVYVMSYGGTGE